MDSNNNENHALFVDICMDLWSGDCDISYEFFMKVVHERIDNLYSHIGQAAHESLAAKGVIDNTGESWIEQDMRLMEQIKKHQQLVEYLENDSNWTP